MPVFFDGFVYISCKDYILQLKPKVSSLSLMSARKNIIVYPQSAFVMAKTCGCKQTGKQGWHMDMQTNFKALHQQERESEIIEAEIEAL
ncbi:MAG: hypothetical protein M3247_00730 [Thermoproteota archaeon]|nr:hypothetical protein [Thermoproteota archaeon]